MKEFSVVALSIRSCHWPTFSTALTDIFQRPAEQCLLENSSPGGRWDTETLARSTGVSKNALFFEQRQKFPCCRSGSKWYQEMDRNGSCLWTLSWTYPFFMVWMLPCWVNVFFFGASSRLQTIRVAAKLCAASEKPIVTSSSLPLQLVDHLST